MNNSAISTEHALVQPGSQPLLGEGLPGKSMGPLALTLYQFRREFVVVGVFSAVSNFLMLTPTLYMLQVYDRVLSSLNLITLVVISTIALFLYAVMAFSEWMRSLMLVRVGVRLDRSLSEKVFRSSFLSYLNPRESDPAKAFGHLITLRQFMTGNGVFAFFDSPWILIYIAVLFMLHPLLGVIAVLFAIVQTNMAWFGHRVTRNEQHDSLREQSRAQHFLQSKLRNVEVMIAMGMLSSVYARWQSLFYRAVLQGGHAQKQSTKITAISKFVRYTQQSMSLAVGAWLVIRGEISPGAMIAANVLMTRALSPIDLIVTSWPQFQASRESYSELDALLKTEPMPRLVELQNPPKGHLSVRGITVVVDGRDKAILNNVSFDLVPGSVTVMIGSSGSGKSTLARCILGIWPKMIGSVLLDGQRIEAFTRDSLGQYIGYLPQDIELFEGTIGENIARMREPDSASVISAARTAGLHQAILRMPKGYDTLVGQAGIFLSGGQKQRVGLARALYGNPSLVVLDEPNASLDDEGEKALMQAVEELRQEQKTVLLISHRPSVLGVADQLIIMEEGRILSHGPRDSILTSLKGKFQ